MSDIAAIRERWSNATIGPWEWDTNAYEWQRYRLLRPIGFHEVIVVTYDGQGNESMNVSNADAVAIAAAPTDIATLLAEVDRLTSELAAAQTGPVVEWQDDDLNSVAQMGVFKFVVGLTGWELLLFPVGTQSSRSVTFGSETGPAGKAAAEAAYRRVIGQSPC